MSHWHIGTGALRSRALLPGEGIVREREADMSSGCHFCSIGTSVVSVRVEILYFLLISHSFHHKRRAGSG